MSAYKDSDSESFTSPSPPLSARPNRWTGPPSTYLSLTEPERGLAASLDQIRDQDLSIHLYNAHALKRRARGFWERKRNGEEFDEEGEGMGWSPPKWWTAWPLLSQEVPREGEVIGEDDGSEAFTLRRRGAGKEGVSGVLEEQLVAVALKFAKERFEEREWMGIDDKMKGSVDRGMKAKTGTTEHDYVSGNDSGESEEGSPPSRQPDALDEEENDDEVLIKEQSGPPEPIALLKPVISADDERSAALLRPSIRHTLSKLDEVLMALHHARETCHQYGARSAANTDDERAKGDDSGSPSKRPRGRPRKHGNLAILPKQANIQLPVTPNSAQLFRAKKTHLGRPQKVYDHLKGETPQEYVVRVARIQKKRLPAFAPLQSPAPRTRSPSAASERSRRSPAKRATSEELKISRQKKLGLRDWSEVLGSAAFVGFSPDVIARAMQRCADLFGEGMAILTLPEAPYTEQDTDFLTTYKPEQIPDFDSDKNSEEDGDESEIEASAPSTSSSFRRKASRELRRISWLCPIESCRNENKGFGYVTGLRRHLSRYHLMAENDIEDLLDDYEGIEGAVHIDGFLKPMRVKHGERGMDKRKRKQKKPTGQAEDGGDLENHNEEANRDSSSSDEGESEDGDDESASEAS